MADEVASLLVRITADGSQAVGVLNGIQATVGTLASSNATLMNKIAAGGALASKVGTTITKTVGVATVAGLAAAAKEAGQLNKELANIGTLSVPNEKLKEYKGKIQDIAIATGKSTSDISEGTYQVVSAFGDASDTMEKVEINAKAAKAGLATTADSINLTSAVTKAYGDTSAAAVQHVADLAFKTVELGQTTFPELAQSMQQVTSLSKELGVSQEELFASYATLTGVTGGAAEVQTQMKAIYTALLKPSENMTKAIKKQGYESGYSMIKTLGFAGTLDALKKATNGSEEEMLGLFNNVRAMPAIMALTGAQADTFATKLGKMEAASGAATKAFEVQTEGVAKTGFTLEQAKVKMQVAAQRFGESAAPIIADFARVVDKASDALANMSDEQRKNIINGAVLTTKIGVGLAVGGKLVTVGTKIVGVAKAIAPALAAVGPVGWIAAGGIAAIGAAAVVGKAAYDNWYDSQYRWTKGLSEGNAKIKESLDSYRNIAALQNEVKDLRLVIENPDSSREQVDAAKARLDEIRQLLEKEYNLVIKSDNSNLDDTIEKIKKISANELQSDINNQRIKLSNLKNKDESYESDRAEAERNYNEALELQTKTSEAKLKIEELQSDTSLDAAEKYRQAKEIFKETMGYEYHAVNEGLDNITGLLYSANGIGQQFTEASQKVKFFNEAIDNLDGSHKEMIAVGTELANWQTELVALNAQAGDSLGVKKALQGIGETVRLAGLDMSGYAQAASLAMNGLTDFNGAVEKFANGDGADLSAVIRDYSTAMDAFGATAEQKQAGLQAFADKLTEIGHAANTLPADKHIEIDAHGNAVEVAGAARKSIEGVPEEHNTKINAEDNTADGVRSAKSAIESITDKTVTITAQFVSSGMSKVNSAVSNLSRAIRGEADGTQNFPGGLAMVNDQRGVADPRELIEHNGNLMMFEGRDVILPLSKGDKVYTAAQTKSIMRGLGIPRYAEGKNNSDAFTNARDDWTHYTRTHAVTTAAEIEKWLEFQEKYKENEKDIQDIEEQVFSLRQKQYSEQTRASEQWLSHETKYNGIAYSEQLDAIDRIRQSTVAAYETGIISHKEYLDTIASYDEKYIDTRKEQIAEMFDISKDYISEHTYFNDWAENGDNPLEAYRRVQNDRLNELRAGELTQKEYDEYMKELGSDMYAERREQSENWLEEQRKYFNMSAEDYAKGIDRMKKYTQEYYANGLLSRREYNEAMTELRHMELDEAASSYDEMLSNQSKYISDMRDKFSKQEQELRDSWTVSDRKTDMATVREQLNLYRGAVTDRGQQKYKELQEQLKQLQRDEELYNLQVANNAVIENLEAEYSKLEADKASVLAGIARNTDIDVSGIVGTLTSNLDGYAGSITTLLQTLINTVANKEFVGPTTNMNDNRNLVNNFYQIPMQQIIENAGLGGH